MTRLAKTIMLALLIATGCSERLAGRFAGGPSGVSRASRAIPVTAPSVIRSNIVSGFDGFNNGNIYKLANGQIWQQTEPCIRIHIAVMPEVLIRCSGDYGQMKVDGIDHAVGVTLVAGPHATAQAPETSSETLPSVIESRIVSDFDGFKMGNIYKLANGQIWEQADYRICVRVRVNPRVTIWKDGGAWRMQVADIDPTIKVRSLVTGSRESVESGVEDGRASPVDTLRLIIATQKARLVASDGTFLGTLTSAIDGDSIANEIGPYGSEISPTSIFNEIGEYGSEISPLSPYNEISSRPPVIVVEGKTIMYVTTNEILSPRVHPDLLRAMLDD